MTLLEEARELKEAIEHARDTLNYRVELDSYKNPALAAVAALWMQEREVSVVRRVVKKMLVLLEGLLRKF